MRTWDAAEWVPIERDGLGSRLMIVADGSVLVRIQERPGAVRDVMARHAPALFCGLALLLACVSLTALGTTYLVHRDAAERLSAQTSQFQDALDTAVTAARLRSDTQIGALLTRTDDLGQTIENASQRADLASQAMLAAMSGSFSTVPSTLDSVAPLSMLSFTAAAGQTPSLRFEHADGAPRLREAQTFKAGSGVNARPLLGPKPRTVACRTRFERSGGRAKHGLQGACVDPIGLHGRPHHRVSQSAFDGEIAAIVLHEPSPPREHAEGPY